MGHVDQGADVLSAIERVYARHDEFSCVYMRYIYIYIHEFVTDVCDRQIYMSPERLEGEPYSVKVMAKRGMAFFTSAA